MKRILATLLICTLALGLAACGGKAESGNAVAGEEAAVENENKAGEPALTEEETTEADLNWHDSDSRTTHEQNDPSFRTEIGSEPVDLAGYATVYLGYPIWWGEEPRIMDTFVETYSFDGITVIPFCTSASSGIGSSGSNLAANAGTGNWLEGRRFSLGTLEEELAAWIEEM